jgi:hypothetical protein
MINLVERHTERITRRDKQQITQITKKKQSATFLMAGDKTGEQDVWEFL